MQIGINRIKIKMGLKLHRTLHIIFESILLLLLIFLIYLCIRRKKGLGLVTFWVCFVLFSISLLLFMICFCFNLFKCYKHKYNQMMGVKLMSGLFVFISYIVLYDDDSVLGELGPDSFFLGVLLDLWSEYRMRRKIEEEENEKDLAKMINNNIPTNLPQEENFTPTKLLQE